MVSCNSSSLVLVAFVAITLVVVDCHLARVRLKPLPEHTLSAFHVIAIAIAIAIVIVKLFSTALHGTDPFDATMDHGSGERFVFRLQSGGGRGIRVAITVTQDLTHVHVYLYCIDVDILLTLYFDTVHCWSVHYCIQMSELRKRETKIFKNVLKS